MKLWLLSITVVAMLVGFKAWRQVDASELMSCRRGCQMDRLVERRRVVGYKSLVVACNRQSSAKYGEKRGVCKCVLVRETWSTALEGRREDQGRSSKQG